MEDSYRILAEGHTVSNDTWVTGLNNNDLIIGPSGSGKTRGYVLPNILQCQGSMVVTDTKGALCSDVRPILEQEGYKVVELNLADCAASPYGYDPLDYIPRGTDSCFSQQAILTMAAGFIPIENPREPYWEQMARVCLETLSAYVLEALPAEEQSLTSVIRLFGELGKHGKYKALMRELEVIAPDSFALSRYRMFQALEDADRTAACVVSTLASKLAPFGFGGAQRFLSNPRKLNIKRLGRKKTAVFLTISDTDPSLYRLADVFYTQALHTLCTLADKSPGHRLKIPVRFYLDDFASNVVIPDFGRIISVIRSREISVSVIIQSLSQLESLYGKPEAMTILGNCDNMLCLGAGRDPETAGYISRQSNKPVSAVLNMPADDAWLLTRGSPAGQVRKYNLRQHGRYHRLPEAAREAQPEDCNTETQYQP